MLEGHVVGVGNRREVRPSKERRQSDRKGERGRIEVSGVFEEKSKTKSKEKVKSTLTKCNAPRIKVIEN